MLYYVFIDLHNFIELTEFEFEFIGVLRHMQRYFSHICDSTDVQADWRRSIESTVVGLNEGCETEFPLIIKPLLP